jgi:hypothetical protein
LLCSGAALADSGITIGVEQESWVTEMGLSSDPFQVMSIYDRPIDPPGYYYAYQWYVDDLIDRAHFHRSFLTISYGASDKLQVYGKVGMTRLYPELKWMRAKGTRERWDWDGEEYYLNWWEEYWTEGTYIFDEWWWAPMELGRTEGTGSAFAVGADWTVTSTPTWSVVVNAEYLSEQDSNVGEFLYHYQDWETNGTTYLDYEMMYDLDTDSATTTQLLASIVGKAKCGSCMPYAGVRYTPVTTTYSGTGYFEETDYNSSGVVTGAVSDAVPFEYTMKSKDDIGLVGGCDFYLGEGWSGNFEVVIQGDWGMSAAIKKEL